ncbi:MAG: hypothetical protein ACR2G7_04825 [Acidimicrobiales bacterium]
MFIAGSRFWFAVTVLALVSAIAYSVGSGAERYGTLVLLSAAVASMIPGLAAVVLRDGEVAVAAADGGIGQHRPTANRFAAAWPALAAVGAGVTVVGLAVGGALLYVGFGILGVVLAEWMVQSWAERSTGDPVVNRRLRNRVMFPIEIPATAAIGIAIFLLSFSRVLLALPKVGSTVFAVVVAVLILGGGVLVATRPRLSSSLLSVIVVLAVLGLLGGGIVGAVAGERKSEAHGTEPTGAEPDGGAPGEAPARGGG